MKNLDVSPSVLVVSPASLPDLQPAPRLIVLVPEFEVDAAIVARKIRDVAKSLESRIQLLGLSKDALHEPAVRRRLVTLSALVEDSSIFVESKVEFGTNWLNALKPHWHAGDVVVCFAEQRSGLLGKPLKQLLAANLNATIYVISGIAAPEKPQRLSWVTSTISWAGSTGLIIGFYWLQAKLAQPPQNWIHTLMLYGSLLAEAGSIWTWNNLFG